MAQTYSATTLTLMASCIRLVIAGRNPNKVSFSFFLFFFLQITVIDIYPNLAIIC
ncbi:hypothetical protein BDV23DRAFT_144735, partial [Aspergillus alliaceus]